MTRAVLRLCAKLSRIPSAIIYNSHVAARQYEAFGFPAGAAVVIPNGFDCDQFQPRAGARAEFCNRFGVDENATIVGLVTRLHPMKQPEVLVERSEEHTSELQSLMRISYAVFCLKKKTQSKYKNYKH